MSNAPLRGLRVVELAGLAPAPFAGMVLADFGADVVRIDRTDRNGFMNVADALSRGKRSIQINLSHLDGTKTLLRILHAADVLIDPYRPGVLERMGLDPHTLLSTNPKLIIARLSGYGQSGPLSARAGHDINYVAMSGVLSVLGRKNQPPTFPANLLADFAGGGIMCVMGILLAIVERHKSGTGQIIDTSMVAGTSYLATFIYKLRQQGFWNTERGTNVLDSGAPFYDVYETSDHKYMAVGAIEPQFYKNFVDGLGLDVPFHALPRQMDPSNWTTLRTMFRTKFMTKTQDEWTRIYEHVDACVTPVVDMDDMMHRGESFMIKSRDQHGNVDPDSTEPAAAPLLSRTPSVSDTTVVNGKPVKVARSVPGLGQHTIQILNEYGFNQPDIDRLVETGIVKQRDMSKL